jgi:hypothetical protein
MTVKVIPRTEVLIRYLHLADELVAQNPDGKLPSATWLKKNGHTGLYQYVRAHPAEFDHFEQEKLGVRTHNQKAINRQVTLAKKLARRNKGRLPTVTWLMEHGYTKLLSCIWKHPKFFEEIPREKNRKTRKDHVRAAEELAERYKGKLPGGSTVVSEAGWALYKFMRRNPSFFVHIPGATNPGKYR